MRSDAIVLGSLAALAGGSMLAYRLLSGRRPKPENDFYVGVDLGGTNILAGVMRGTGEVVHTQEDPVGTASGLEIVEAMWHTAQRVVKCAGLEMSAIRAIGIGSPGIINKEKGIVEFAACVRGFKNMEICSHFREWSGGIPTFLENDAKCAALAEKCYGAGSSVKSMVMYGSASAAVEIAKEKLSQPGAKSSMVLSELTEAKRVFEHAKAGDALALSVVDEVARGIAMGCANLCRAYDPDVIAFSGGMSRSGDFLLSRIRKQFLEINWKATPSDQVSFEAAKVGTNSGLIGAALTAKIAVDRR